MRLVVHQEIPDDVALAHQWNDLVMQMERPEVFYTYEWALAASRAFSTVVQPLVFLVYDASQLCGVAPWQRGASSRGPSFS